MVFHWSLSDSKSPQVSRTRLSILAVLSNAVVWIVSTRPPTSKSFRPFNNPVVTVPNAPITIGTIIIFTFHSFFSSLARSRYLSFFSLSFRFIIIIIISLLASSSHQHELAVFPWNLSDSKSSQISRTLLSILADFNNAVVWTVSIFPEISYSFSLFSKPLGTVSNAPTTTVII